MERFLIFIKHHFYFIWRIIEFGNSYLFTLIYKSSLERIIQGVFLDLDKQPYVYRRLLISDAASLYELINSQKNIDLEYFKPHQFDNLSIVKQFSNRSFLMMGTFYGNRLVGYFFLRFFANRKCFVGRLIDKNYRGRGIGQVMNKIMYETAWRMNFRCLSTISQDNEAVMRSHSKNKTMIVLKKLQNNYLLVEFKKNAETT